MAPSIDPSSNTQASALEDVSKVKSALLSADSSSQPSRSSQPTRSHTPIDHIIANNAGYTDTVFEGKADQAAQVKQLLSSKGFMPPHLVTAEVDWFYQ